MRWLCVLALMVAAGSACAAGPVKRIYVFGDSYSDMGRGWLASDGPTAVVYLSRRLGLEMVPSTAKDIAGKSLDFAVSGAITGSNPGKPEAGGVVKLGMVQQVGEFTAMVKSGAVSFDPETTLFFLAGGLNDRDTAPSKSAGNLEREMTELYEAGARRFEVAILPELVPSFGDVTTLLNPLLAAMPAKMQKKLKGAEIANSQWGVDFDYVLMHSDDLGFTNMSDACVRGDPAKAENICPDPGKHYYYFTAHPSTAVHKIVGDMLYQELQHF